MTMRARAVATGAGFSPSRRRCPLAPPNAFTLPAATFDASLPAGVRWPLDHVFVTDDVALCPMERQGRIGSDRVPLLVDVLLQREGSHP